MVDIRATGHAAATSKAGGAGDGAAEAALVQGSRNGETVAVLEKDAVALADELKEEMGIALEDDAEDEMAREDRKVTADKRAATAGIAGAQFEKIMEDAQNLVDLRARKDELEKLAAAMSSRGLTNPSDIAQYLKDNLGERKGESGPNHDVTQQYGALVMMEKMMVEAGNAEMAGAFRAAADQLLAENAEEINKGLAVSGAADIYSSDQLGSVSDLRALYMDQVVAHKGILASFNSILEKHGEKGFGDAVAFLLRAAGDDLATMTSANDRAQHKEVLDNLYQLEVLNTMRERSDEVLGRIKKSFPVAEDASAHKIMRDTFGMIESSSRTSEPGVTKLARETVPESVEGRISFLREYRGLANLIPIKVLDNADPGSGGLRVRERLLEAIGQAQDVADQEEQQKLAAG